LDIAKVYDRVDHYGLYIKLMKRNAPVCLLNLLEGWLARGASCVKWNNTFSGFFRLELGVRQGSVLAPALFAVYINDVICMCDINGRSYGYILVYADDILLICRSREGLQYVFNIVQVELRWLNLALNVDKSCCMRLGHRYDKMCCSIVTLEGTSIRWVNEMRYLGVYLVSGRAFMCSIDARKKSFNRAANCVLGRLGGKATEDLILHLVKVQCLPTLLFGAEACNFNKAKLGSLDFALIRFGMKIFKSGSRPLVIECYANLGIRLPSVSIGQRIERFLFRWENSENYLCKAVQLL